MDITQGSEPLTYTVAEVAAMLKLSEHTVRELCKAHQKTNGATGLPAAKVGRSWRISRRNLLRYLGGEAA